MKRPHQHTIKTQVGPSKPSNSPFWRVLQLYQPPRAPPIRSPLSFNRNVYPPTPPPLSFKRQTVGTEIHTVDFRQNKESQETLTFPEVPVPDSMRDPTASDQINEENM